MAASSDAVTDTTDPKWNAAGGRVALTSLAILVLIYQRHGPEPLFGIIWIKNVLDYVAVSLGALLLGQQLRVAFRGVRAGVRKVREFSKATVTFFKNMKIVKITVEVPEPKPAAANVGPARGDDDRAG